MSFLCKHILAPFLDKFGDYKSTLVKYFVEENTDFFREDIVIMEWLHVLEMSVKFENEEAENINTRGSGKKMIKSKLDERNNTLRQRKEDSKSIHSGNKLKSAKIKEMSKSVYGKIERRKRKYKKKQIEYIGWYYDEVKEDKIRELLNIVTFMSDTPESLQFYHYLFNTAFHQHDSKGFSKFNYDLINTNVVPLAFSSHKPVLLTQTLKCLFLYSYYSKLCLPAPEFSIAQIYKTTYINALAYPQNEINSIPKYEYFTNKNTERGVSSLVKSIMLVDMNQIYISNSKSRDRLYETEDDYTFGQNFVFLNDGIKWVREQEDVEMTGEVFEESKVLNSSNRTGRAGYKPLRSDKDINFRQWDVNIRDKLNLNKYTKTLYMGQSLLKHRMDEHKKTFLPKTYVPFKFSNQQMYKIIKPEEPEKIMKEIKIDSAFEVDYVELLTKYEFPAVLRLKKKFMGWF